ncbi:MAG TPA: hypothetical protein VGW33_13900 [Terriglobia bacterium]|nr:hypothetical protein [Terriglobia bacterium]
MRTEFSAVPFHDPGKAEDNLARLEERLAPSLLVPLAALLAESPDPDGALNLLERYSLIAPPDVRRDLAQHPTALTYLVAIFGYSGFLAETFLAEPALAVEFARDRNFTQLKSTEDLMQDYARFSTTSPDVWLAAQLARFKQRNYLRIVLKDVLGLSTLAETTQALSALANVILANALAYCDQELVKRYGQPQYRDAEGRIARSGFSIVSLGKLGGDELNYSSDVDLLFLYSHDGETAGGNEPDSVVANKEYFVRLAHALTRTLTQSTPAGPVFRLDLRLRPEGSQGDLTISLHSALEYYERRARDWELQMLLKARHSAGDAALTRAFLRGVEPRVYSSPANFAAVESVLVARERTSRKLRESERDAMDVKRHRGGIRDIEFLTQCLQRLHGGRDPWVRSGGTLHALRKLNDKRLLSDRDYAALATAYEFLRKVEHRIQLDRGQQTHRLPAGIAALDRLARRAGVEPGPRPSPGTVLVHRLRRTFARVDAIHGRVIHPGAASPPRHGPDGPDSFELTPPESLAGRPHSYAATLRFLNSQAPDLAEVVKRVDLPERAQPHVARFFAALAESPERFASARRQIAAVRQAMEALSASHYLAGLLVRHPEDVAALEPAPTTLPDPVEQRALPLSGSLAPAGAPPGFPSFPWITENGLGVGGKMAALRREYRQGILALGAQDCCRLDSVFDSFNRWSQLAARAVSSALLIAGEALEITAGPSGGSGRLAVLALGRLGVGEFDLASDADLVFVITSPVSPDDLTLWTRVAEKTIEVLSSYTSDGTVFAVDTRLRPRGQEGELVVTSDALARYLAEASEPWEALAYLKAWPVAGDLELGYQLAARVISTLFARFAAHPHLEAELHGMRRRLETEIMVPPSDTKTAPGGYYDVDFAVSYLRLRHCLLLPSGLNLPQQIEALRSAGHLADGDAGTLTAGAEFLRSLDHAIRLVTGRPARGLPEHVGHAEAVAALARRWGLVEEGATLAARLREVQQQVREVYRRLLGAE